MVSHFQYESAQRAISTLLAVVICVLSQLAALRVQAQAAGSEGLAGFPSELIRWSADDANPVFESGGRGAWDTKIRERGWILRGRDGYRLWYTGYDGTREGIKRLGYATSSDGLHWTRWPNNPLVADHWIEDVMVVHCGGVYYMFVEGAAAGHAELFTSSNGVDWQWQGPLDIRLADGVRAARRPCGTPTVWIEHDVWYLLYEWHDRGVWLAKSRDPLSRVWRNVMDEPVLVPGPAEYDAEMIAVDQVIKRGDEYFAFYHGCGKELPRVWTTNIARSRDLVHWQKFAGNPIVAGNRSSGIVVSGDHGLRLYTMHEQVDVFYSREASEKCSAATSHCYERTALRQPACVARPCRKRLFSGRLRCIREGGGYSIAPRFKI